jgi:hypothetical protein
MQIMVGVLVLIIVDVWPTTRSNSEFPGVCSAKPTANEPKLFSSRDLGGSRHKLGSEYTNQALDDKAEAVISLSSSVKVMSIASWIQNLTNLSYLDAVAKGRISMLQSRRFEHLAEYQSQLRVSRIPPLDAALSMGLNDTPLALNDSIKMYKSRKKI